MISFKLCPGDNYSQDVFNLLKDQLNFSDDGKIQLLFPYNVSQFNKNKKNILILDYGYFTFDPITEISTKYDWDLIISPLPLKTSSIVKEFSFCEEIFRSQTKQSENHLKDIVFCSQPLKEDQRHISYDQYQLEVFIRSTLKKSFPELNLLVKAHPRENRSSNLEGTIFETLERYDTWIGHSSMVLYGAKALGHKVLILKDFQNLNEKMESSIIEFLSKEKPNIEKVNLDINLKEIFSDVL